MIKEILNHYFGIQFECKECTHLRTLVEAERRDKSRILDSLLELTRPKVPEPEPILVPQEIKNPVMRTSQLRAILEQKSKMKQEADERVSEIRKNRTEELEKELGVG